MHLLQCKDSHIFSTINNSVFVILTFQILTKRLPTTSLILNNRTLFAKIWVVFVCGTSIYVIIRTKKGISAKKYSNIMICNTNL